MIHGKGVRPSVLHKCWHFLAEIKAAQMAKCQIMNNKCPNYTIRIFMGCFPGAPVRCRQDNNDNCGNPNDSLTGRFEYSTQLSTKGLQLDWLQHQLMNESTPHRMHLQYFNKPFNIEQPEQWAHGLYSEWDSREQLDEWVYHCLGIPSSAPLPRIKRIWANTRFWPKNYNSRAAVTD